MWLNSNLSFTVKEKYVLSFLHYYNTNLSTENITERYNKCTVLNQRLDELFHWIQWENASKLLACGGARGQSRCLFLQPGHPESSLCLSQRAAEVNSPLTHRSPVPPRLLPPSPPSSSFPFQVSSVNGGLLPVPELDLLGSSGAPGGSGLLELTD